MTDSADSDSTDSAPTSAPLDTTATEQNADANDAAPGQPTEPVPVVDADAAPDSDTAAVIDDSVDPNPALDETAAVSKTPRPVIGDEIARLKEAGVINTDDEGLELAKAWYREDPPLIKGIDQLTAASPSRAGFREHVIARIQLRQDEIDDAAASGPADSTDAADAADSAEATTDPRLAGLTDFQLTLLLLAEQAQQAHRLAQPVLDRRSDFPNWTKADHDAVARAKQLRHNLAVAILEQGRNEGVSEESLFKPRDGFYIGQEAVEQVFADLQSDNKEIVKAAETALNTFWFYRMAIRAIREEGDLRAFVLDFSFPGRRRPADKAQNTHLISLVDRLRHTPVTTEVDADPAPSSEGDPGANSASIDPSDASPDPVADPTPDAEPTPASIDEPIVTAPAAPTLPKVERFWQGQSDADLLAAATAFFADDANEAAGPHDAMRHLSDQLV